MLNKSWRTSSIVARLTILYSLALIIAFAIGSAILYWGLTRAIRHELNLIVRDRLEAVSGSLNRYDGPEVLRERVIEEFALRRSEVTYIKVEDLKTKEILAITPDHEGFNAADYFVDLPLIESAQGKGREFYQGKGRFYGSTRDIFTIGKSRRDYRVSIVISSDRENRILEQYRFSAFGTLLVMTLISMLAGGRLAKFSLRPLDAIVEKTKSIQASKLSERINEKNMPKEIANLASTLNGALDRLEESFERMARFSSGIAHELRTPVTNIMLQIEVALNSSNNDAEEYKDVMVSVIEESRRLTKMIDKLLLLARIEYPEQSLQIESVDLLHEMHNIIDFYMAMAEENNLRISFSVDEGLRLLCDRSLFQRAITNLITNAINYTPAGGQIEIRALRNGSSVCVSVKDTGIGIPKADMERVFDRFYRVDPSRHTTKIAGFGLGLSIVQSVMKLHSGEVRIESEEKQGTTATLIFPERPRPPAEKFSQA